MIRRLPARTHDVQQKFPKKGLNCCLQCHCDNIKVRFWFPVFRFSMVTSHVPANYPKWASHNPENLPGSLRGWISGDGIWHSGGRGNRIALSHYWFRREQLLALTCLRKQPRHVQSTVKPSTVSACCWPVVLYRWASPLLPCSGKQTRNCQENAKILLDGHTRRQL